MYIDGHWVINGDTAQQMLFEQGYDIARYQTRHRVRWAYMTKEIDEAREALRVHAGINVS